MKYINSFSKSFHVVTKRKLEEKGKLETSGILKTDFEIKLKR